MIMEKKKINFFPPTFGKGKKGGKISEVQKIIKMSQTA